MSKSSEDLLILDGGLSTELEAVGFKIQGDPLWSARILHTNPGAIKEAHCRFLASGADVITTCTYQASIEGFMQHLSLTSEQAEELLRSGVRLAKEAINDIISENFPSGRKRPMVAGSVGPYGASLHDGSEYTGSYEACMSLEELKAWHRPQIHALVESGADLIAMETIPSFKEAQALVDLLREFPNTKAWLSFSCKDSQTIANGTKFSQGVEMACRSPQLIAVGVNCCPPGLVSPLLESAKHERPPGVGWVVYPNSGEGWDPVTGWTPSEEKPVLAGLPQQWVTLGASVIGTQEDVSSDLKVCCVWQGDVAVCPLQGLLSSEGNCLALCNDSLHMERGSCGRTLWKDGHCVVVDEENVAVDRMT